MVDSGDGPGWMCGTGPAPLWASKHVSGARTVSIPTEGDFTQELIRPSEGGHWTYCQGLCSSGPPGPPRRGASPPPATRGPTGHLADQDPEFDYKRFNRSNVSIRRWSWNYRSCWHQTCPPVGTHHGVWIASIPSPTSDNAGGIATARRCLTRVLLYWAICVPAAHLGSGSRFSGSLSGIKPKFSVTRCRHCGPLRHSPELIGQKFV